MKARCFKCGEVYGISIFHSIGRHGYERPVCERKRKAEEKANGKTRNIRKG